MSVFRQQPTFALADPTFSRYLIKFFLFTVLYYVTARLGLLLPFTGEVTTLFWPSTALTLAVLLVFGLRYWPVPLFGALAVAIYNGHSLPLTIGITIAHTAQLFVIAFILHRFPKFDTTLNRLPDVLALISLGMAGPALGGVLAILSFQLSPEGSGKVMTDLLWHWWAGHSISILTLTPAAVTNWSNPAYDWSLMRLTEALIAYLLLILVGVLIFIRLPFGNIPLGHAVFPFLVWLAVRFGPREVTLGGFIIMFLAVLGTLQMSGPFSRPSLNVNLLLLVTFVDSVVVTALIINAIISNWRAGQVALRHSNELLESRVGERTQALTSLNVDLQSEIDERARIEHELLVAKDKALEALAAKSQLLAHVSHDARTPISTISLYAQLIQTGRYGLITPEQHKALQTILNNATELEEFFENLLTQAESTLPEESVNLQPLRLEEWLVDLQSRLAPFAERKELTFRTDIEPDVPAVVLTDHQILKHIVTNLLSNAIKFTDAGEVILSLRRPDDECWQICITDTGPGIAPADLGRIFDAFWQVDGSMTRQAHRGIGLGLAIVKRNTELLNGKIHVASEIGRGSTFTVSLPLSAEAQSTF